MNNNQIKNKNLFKKAHLLTKEIKAEFKNVDYKSQLGICIKFLIHNKSVSAFVGAINQLFQQVKMKVKKTVEFSNGSFGYTFIDEKGNLYKWLTTYKIENEEILLKRFIIKRHITQNGKHYNSIGRVLI